MYLLFDLNFWKRGFYCTLAGQIQITANSLQRVAALLENLKIGIQKCGSCLKPIVSVTAVFVAVLLLRSPQNN